MIKVAIYCRLSNEDRHKEHEQESESIQNQKSMLVNYAIEQGWDIYKIFADEDYSGTDSSRPEFNEMLRDAEARKFQIVLAKTQSRFTRDMEHVEKYLHNKFPEWGIRFISIVDSMDTFKKDNKKNRQISGLVNDWYSEDLSDNLRSTFMSKKKEGKFIGGFTPYGYKKDPEDKHRLIIDEEPAAIVKEIFDLYLKGRGLQQIAKHLNMQGIPSPAKYKKLNGSNYMARMRRSSVLKGTWHGSAVHQILRNRVYLGTVIQNKSTTVSYKNKKKITIPKDQWVSVENMHEPIIDPETFKQAQKVSDAKMRPQQNGTRHIFSGKVKCGYCNGMLVKCGTKDQISLRCQTRITSKDLCEYGASIPMWMLHEKVLCGIKELINEYTSEESICGAIGIRNDLSERMQSVLEEENRIIKQKKEIDTAVTNLYMDKVKGTVSEEHYIKISQTFTSKTAGYDKRLEVIREQKRLLEERQEKNIEKAEIVKKHFGITELTKEIVDEFVDHITIKNVGGARRTTEREVKIYWNI